MRFVFTTIGLSIQIIFLSGQELTNQLRQKDLAFLSQEKFADNLYGEAAFQAGLYPEQRKPALYLSNEKFQKDIRLTEVISLLRLETPESEKKVVDFIRSCAPDPIINPAVAALGSYYYNKKWYKKAIEAYTWGNPEHLPAFDQGEYYFKLGYSQFVTKDFRAAQKSFEKALQSKEAYKEASTYYNGLCEYFLGRYPAAIEHLQKVKNYSEYAPYIPYYLIQIYFSRHEYNKVIEEGESALLNNALTNRKEIRQLTGQAYFRTNLYEKALPHLEYYEKNTQKLTFEEFYQLAMTHYNLGHYGKAAAYFRELQQSEGERGQQIHYFLADCFYKTEDFVSARAAFRKVSQMDFDPLLQEEALLNYGKLSAQTGLDTEAIVSLRKIGQNSTHYAEAERVIMYLLNQMEDTGTALEIMKNMSPLPANMTPLLHRLKLRMALQHVRNDAFEAGVGLLQELTQTGVNDSIRCQSYFWLANERHKQNDFESSIAFLKQYFNAQPEKLLLPAESSVWSAYYLQGYNYHFLKMYSQSTDFFIKAATFKSSNLDELYRTDQHKAIVSDAIIRAGDGFFARNQYKEALHWYDQAIQKNTGSVDYALYQKAMILGLNDEPYEKIVILNLITQKHNKSMWADDAWMALGATYQMVDNTENAFISLKTLTEMYPNSPYIPEAFIKMALIAYNKGDLEQAAQYYRNVFNHRPDPTLSQSALLGLEEIYIKDLGRSEDYVSFVNSIPGYSISELTSDSLYFMVGALKFNEAAYEKAVKAFSTYLEKFPKGVKQLEALYYRAESNTLLKKYSDALKDYESVLNLGGSVYFLPALKKSAIISYSYVQDFEKAYQYYLQYHDTISEENEKYKAAMNALKSAFKTSMSQGVQKFAPIISLSEKASTEDRSQAQYYLAKVLLKEENYKEAIVAFTSASEKINNAQAAECRYQIAYIYFKTEDYEKAEMYCHQANELNGAYPIWIARTLLLLSDIYINKKDYLNAKAAVEAIIENFNNDEEILSLAKDALKRIEKLEISENRLEKNDSDLLKMQTKNK